MFIDPETRDTVHVQEYVSRLFPQFRGNQLHMVAKNYEHLGAPFSKVIQIMGEGKVVTMKEDFGYADRSFIAIFVCPTYYVLRGLDGTGYKVCRHSK
jgi:hypothetical protein